MNLSITIEEMIEAGVHFGHQTRRWNPKSKPYVCAERAGFSIIDLEKTMTQLKAACTALEKIAATGGKIWFIGTKRHAQQLIREAAQSVNMPFCASRWMGGCLTNFSTIQRSLSKYKNFLSMEADGSMDALPKKEIAVIRREMARMHRNFEGLLEVTTRPQALFIIDTKTHYIAVEEARRLKIPVIALVDTNSDPTLVDYPVPANDDNPKGLRLLLSEITAAIQHGMNFGGHQVVADTAPVEGKTHAADIVETAGKNDA
jgi:small subunit ribosomal protein S2